MTAAAPNVAAAATEPRRLIAAFASQASFETAHLAPGDLAALRAGFAAGTAVYVSAVASRPPAEQIDIVSQVAAAGFEPVPHVAARSFASGADLDSHLGRLAEHAVRRVLVISGDEVNPTGPFHSAVELIESGLMQKRGIVEIGVAGFPDGHPRMTAADLDRALAAKLDAAAATGLAAHIVTQFSFSADAILGWNARLRDLGIDQPVRVGLPGPVTLAGLMRYARICGVGASAEALAGSAGLSGSAFAMVTPDAVLRRLAVAPLLRGLGDAAPHFYAFGGLAAAARWAAAVAAGRITLDHDGFSVEPP
jgi:methylenetetrahydrofolate reductase (NADPH)